nr:DNA polymerase III subunit theta [Citrobacter freundii]
MHMSKWNIASFSKEEQDKVSVDKAAAAVAWQERMNRPVVPELAEREQPEHLRQYFRERLDVHRQNSRAFPFSLRATSLTGTGAVMLRTGSAALSRPGPFGAAGFHPWLSQRQKQACCDRSGHAALARRFLRFSHPGGNAAGL